MSKQTNTTSTSGVRLDKWLWAARFYKTRSIAKEMIDGGKVHYQGLRVKPSKEVALNATIRLRQGEDEKTVIVTEISDKRGNATRASELYQETTESITEREQTAEQRKLQHASAGKIVTEGRPSKKQRRKIIQFNQQQS
ncbi:MAG: heat-shock protein [Moraxellaceae bacterium]|nr:MAG: heat-shock protein [Moraxellaceae bacterium]